MPDWLAAAWLGGLTVSGGALATATTYVLWRYAYVPWRVMRTDMGTLAAQVAALQGTVAALANPRKPTRITDSREAEIEREVAAAAQHHFQRDPQRVR